MNRATTSNNYLLFGIEHVALKQLCRPLIEREKSCHPSLSETVNNVLLEIVNPEG